MKIVIDTRRSIEDNATRYYDKSKKAKRKVEGLKKAIEVTKKKILRADKEIKIVQKKYKTPPDPKWYMKFRWFISSDGLLCIGGRDAITNDIIIKKYAEKDDLVLHTEMPGSPFFVIKSEGKDIPDTTMEEAAIATASFSRAWREGIGSAEVYVVQPNQVKKELGLPRGSFMIHGKRRYFQAVIKLYIGMNIQGYLECGPVPLEFGLVPEGKKSDCAKKIQQKIMDLHDVKFELDDIIRALPGDCSLEK